MERPYITIQERLKFLPIQTMLIKKNDYTLVKTPVTTYFGDAKHPICIMKRFKDHDTCIAYEIKDMMDAFRPIEADAIKLMCIPFDNTAFTFIEHIGLLVCNKWAIIISTDGPGINVNDYISGELVNICTIEEARSLKEFVTSRKLKENYNIEPSIQKYIKL